MASQVAGVASPSHETTGLALDHPFMILEALTAFLSSMYSTVSMFYTASFIGAVPLKVKEKGAMKQHPFLRDVVLHERFISLECFVSLTPALQVKSHLKWCTYSRQAADTSWANSFLSHGLHLQVEQGLPHPRNVPRMSPAASFSILLYCTRPSCVTLHGPVATSSS